MQPDRPLPAPFDASTFIVPMEWHAFSDLLGGPDTGLLLLREGDIVLANARLLEQLGFTEEELSGRPVTSLFPRGKSKTPDSEEGSHIRLLNKAKKAIPFHIVANRIDAYSDAEYTIWVLRPVPPSEEVVPEQAIDELQQQKHQLATDKKRQLHYFNRLLRMAQRPHANLGPVLRVLAKSCAKVLATHRCAYWEIGTEPTMMRCVVAYDDLRQNIIEEEPKPAPAAAFYEFMQQMLRGEHQMSIADTDQDPRVAPYCEYFQTVGIKALVVVPVHREDGVQSALLVADTVQPRNWRKEEVEFVAHVAALVAHLYAQAEKNRTEAQLRQLQRIAHQDSLTGLPNRHFLFDRSQDIFKEVSARSASLAAFFIDLDGFKQINDAFGHAVGDELLKAAAMRLKNLVRKDDILVRLGGDEFVLLARNLTDMRIADDIAMQIVETLRNAFLLQGRELQISASVGIAIYPFDGTDIDTLMKKADIAMYHAKAAGRDQYQMFEPKISESMSHRSTMENELRRAIQEQELQHFYQPQIDLRTGQIRCIEALLRWRHPERGLLLPSNFLPVAEQSGLIHHISRWVLNDACNQLRIWDDHGLEEFNLAINLSASQLMDRTLMSSLESALDRTGIPGWRLEWEVKESTVMQHNTMATSMLDRMTDMGIKLTIDDFGTGYSSFSYLRRYSVHKVKIDSGFVDGLPGEGDDCAITDAIIRMAHPLGLEVVAEGVETQQQVEYLREHGCSIGQGYFFTQPLTAEQFEKWLVRH